MDDSSNSRPDSLGEPSDTISHDGFDLLSKDIVDPVLAAKMHLVNNVSWDFMKSVSLYLLTFQAIDEIGFTPYHARLFCLNGFGYAVDSLITLLQSIISGQAILEFQPSYSTGLTIAAYVGMLTGALFWGLSADIIGRRFAFNVSLFISSIFTIVAGASPNWVVLGLFVCLSAFGAGGNLVLDTAVFLEYLPSRHQWLITLMAAWWGAIIAFLSVSKLTSFHRTRPAYCWPLCLGIHPQLLLHRCR